MLGWRNYRHKSPVERHRKSLFLPYFYSDRRAILFSECVRGYWDHLGEIDAVGELICTSRQEWCGGFFGTSNAFQRPHLLLSHQLEIGPPFTQKALLLKLWCKKYKLQREVVPRQRPGCLGLGGKATRRRTELATSGGRERALVGSPGEMRAGSDARADPCEEGLTRLWPWTTFLFLVLGSAEVGMGTRTGAGFCAAWKSQVKMRAIQ